MIFKNRIFIFAVPFIFILASVIIFNRLLDIEFSEKITPSEKIAAPPVKTGAVYQIGVVSRFSPSLLYRGYQPLISYLNQKTPYSFELHLNKTYSEAVQELAAGKLHAPISDKRIIAFRQIQNKLVRKCLFRSLGYLIMASISSLVNNRYGKKTHLSDRLQTTPELMTKEEEMGLKKDVLAEQIRSGDLDRAQELVIANIESKGKDEFKREQIDQFWDKKIAAAPTAEHADMEANRQKDI